MSDETPAADANEDASLLLDEFDEKLAAFQTLRKSDSSAADELLSSLGAQDDVDKDIVLELASKRPLGHPDRFPQAHAMAVRALEVLDRNGARPVKVSGLGLLNPIAAFFVQQVAHFIVRSHQSAVADEMLRLYGRREANCLPDDPQRRMLIRARTQMERVTPGFKRNALGVPVFLLGGAVLSTLMTLIQRALVTAMTEWWTRALATVIVGVFMLGVGWVILRGAAVARRRIQLTLDDPIKALWQTIGRCGEPPRDPSRTVALIAIILVLLPWLLIPTGLLVSWITELF
ncbi:MAG: hypothetical protein QNJ77_09205 [Acidimicrobiia bacterium]|nr:hypothetical protein [Acidimicrobiia bacterium]